MTKKLICLLLALCTLFSFGGCGLFSSEQSPAEKIESRYDIVQNGPLRDKDLVYSSDNPTEIVSMYLTVSTGNSGENTNHTWEEVNSYSAYDYDEMGVDRYKVAGLLQVGNENGPLPEELGYGQVSPNCTVQIRGQSSSRNAQKNYKIKLKDNKGEWRGQTTIALNKHQGDGLRFRNKLAYDLIKGIDQLMGLRTTFVRLYVKDTTASGDGQFHDYGIYTQVEQLNKTALEAHGLDRNGHLYKINYCEFYRYEDVIKLKTDPTYNQKAFEEILEIKGDDDHQKLIDLLTKINDFTIPIETVIEENFDMENLTYWMAFHLLMGNIDTQSRNFYLYSPLNSNTWYILTWDCDGSLKRSEYEVLGRTDQSGWEKGVSNYWGNVLFQRCLKSSQFRQALDTAVEDIKAYLTPELISSTTQSYASIIKPYIYAGPDATYAPLTSEEYDYVVSCIPKDIENNYIFYKESFNFPMPFFIATPKKTDAGISVMWDAAFDFDSETVTYSAELATDCYFNEIVASYTGLDLPTITFPPLAPGQYFVRVIATNKSGYSQPAFDSYLTETGKVYGTKCFYVNQDGSLVEEYYVET